MEKLSDGKFSAGEIVHDAAGNLAEVCGYTSIACGTVALKGANGRQWSAHEDTLTLASMEVWPAEETARRSELPAMLATIIGQMRAASSGDVSTEYRMARMRARGVMNTLMARNAPIVLTADQSLAQTVAGAFWQASASENREIATWDSPVYTHLQEAFARILTIAYGLHGEDVADVFELFSYYGPNTQLQDTHGQGVYSIVHSVLNGT